jgi:iron complex outermembrane receptor protein
VDNHRREFEASKDTAALDMRLATTTYNMKFHLPIQNEKHMVTLGVQGMYQSNDNSGVEVLVPDAITIDNGIYALWIATYDKLNLQAGIRADQRDLNGLETHYGQNEVIEALDRSFSNINYSAALFYKINNSLLRLSFSSGFRAPNTSELLSMGKHEGTNRFEIGDKNLISENAHQIDLSYVYTNEHIEITVNPYSNLVQNYIYLEPTDSLIDGSQVFYYSQTNALLYGGELSIHIHPHSIHWLHVETAYSSITGIDSDKNYLALMPANNINSTIKAEFKGKRKFYISDIFVQHLFKFSQTNTALNESSSDQYQTVSVGVIAKYKLEKSALQLKSGINNLFNETFVDHLSRLKTFSVPGQGRNVYLGVRLSF